MTREEAIRLLHDMKDTYDEIHENTNFEIGYEQMTALDMAIEALSADADGDDLIIKGAKGIQDGLYNIKDGKLFKYKANGGTVRTYPIVPSADAVSREAHYDAVANRITDMEERGFVSVVRCKDCRHYEDGMVGYCWKVDRGVSGDFFCAYGERREE